MRGSVLDSKSSFESVFDSENIVDRETSIQVVDNKKIVGSESWRARGQGVDVVFDDFCVRCFVSVSKDAIHVDEVAVEDYRRTAVASGHCRLKQGVDEVCRSGNRIVSKRRRCYVVFVD
jgi:hypothetical protein